MKKKPEKNPVYSGITMETLDCRACGQRFMVQSSFHTSIVLEGDDFWCPRGHVIYHGEGRKKRDEDRRLKAEKQAEVDRQEKAKLEELVNQTLWYRFKNYFTN